MPISEPGTLTVRVLLFAQVRSATGRGEVELAVPPTAASSDEGPRTGTPTVGDAIATLLLRHPEIEPHLPSCRVAVGLDYASLDQELRNGDELSLIPPVQGG